MPDFVADFRVSFDVPTLVQHLNTVDPLALVIRAHLYVEAALIRMIEAAMLKKEALDVAKIQFRTKLRLAIALGKLDARHEPAIAALNTLRNRFAHNLASQLNERDELNLYNSLSDEPSLLADSLRKADLPFLTRLRCDVMAIIMQSEAAAQGKPLGRVLE